MSSGQAWMNVSTARIDSASMSTSPSTGIHAGKSMSGFTITPSAAPSASLGARGIRGSRSRQYASLPCFGTSTRTVFARERMDGMGGRQRLQVSLPQRNLINSSLAPVATATAAAGQTRTEFPNLRHLSLSSFWFGSFFLWIPVSSILLQNRVDTLVPQHNLQNTGVGVAAGIGGFLAVTVPPIVGAWSDRLKTRFGRRRPIMVIGTLLALPGLFLMMAAANYPDLVLGYAIIQFFFNAAGAAYAGVVPDVVPAQQFGKASGFLGTMTLFGIAAGTGATFVFGDVPILYFLIAIVVVVSIVPTLWAAEGEGAAVVVRQERKPVHDRIREFLRPLHQ